MANHVAIHMQSVHTTMSEFTPSTGNFLRSWRADDEIKDVVKTFFYCATAKPQWSGFANYSYNRINIIQYSHGVFLYTT